MIVIFYKGLSYTRSKGMVQFNTLFLCVLFEFIGWNDFEVNSLIFIEWPERVHRVYKSSDIMIDFDLDIEGRKVKIKSMSSKGTSLIKNIESEIKLQKNIIIL